MDENRILRGIELRYALTEYLGLHGPCTIPVLIAGLAEQGFRIGGYPAKTVSDALRWERRYGRVVKRGRGIYDYWEVPRSTGYRMHQRVLALREQAAALRAAEASSTDV